MKATFKTTQAYVVVTTDKDKITTSAYYYKTGDIERKSFKDKKKVDAYLHSLGNPNRARILKK